MKKLLLLGAAIATLSLASCTKDYTCTCEAALFGSDAESFLIEDATKSEAKDSCDIANDVYTIFGGSCELD